MLARDTASTGLGIDVHDVAPGRARATMRVGAGMLNGHGTCHGGYVFLLADTAFAAACNSHGTTTVAAGADIVFAAPVHGGDLLVATATERTRYGRNGVYDVTVARDDGAVVAEFRGRSRELPRRVEGR
ncbi:hydroxyphenylacetyl-CoA thioesterase PaaI [Marinactinospora thermotolerans]|uniref:hydroxyphenylacetyl-CoA thioesterase PaaI n=1 Tax=Marinactinospora thermotolerans TaxID=531310 RepID=UPI003D8B04F3